MRADLPLALNEIILMAMTKDPAQRFQSADAFRAALKSVPVSALPGSGTTVTHAPNIPSSSWSQTTLVETPLPKVHTTAAPARASAPSTNPPKSATPPPAYQPTVVATQPATPSVLPPPALARSSSGRGLWVAFGALIGVGVLIAAGIYIPRKVFTHADPGKTAIPPAASSTNPGATSNAAASGTTLGTPPASGNTVSLQGDKGSITVDSQGNVAIQSPNGSLTTSASGDVSFSSKRVGNPLTP